MYLCFVKQTTAYEMRISDWSSDVCSSDLAGWPSLACAPEYGGQGLPITLNNSVYEMFNSANQAWLMYAGLSHSAYECLRTHGTQQQRAVYLPKLVSGQWTGTMRSEEHTSELQSLMRNSYAVFCLKKKKKTNQNHKHTIIQKRPNR